MVKSNADINLERVTINGVLPLKAARRDAVAPGHQRLNFDRSIYIRFTTPSYAAGAVIIANIFGVWVQTPVLF